MKNFKYLLFILPLIIMCCSLNENKGTPLGKNIIENKRLINLYENSNFYSVNTDTKVLKLLKQISFEFKLNNKDESKFGFKTFEADEPLGPRGICLIDSFAYISDPVHNSIKKINCYNGRIILSKTMGTLPLHIRNIIAFNSKLYCISDADSILICDKDLNEISSISGRYNTIKTVFSRGDTIRIILSKDQLKNLNYKYEFLAITKDSSFIERDVIIPIKEHSVLTKHLLTSGLHAFIFNENDVKYVSNEYGNFEIPLNVNEIEDHTGNLIDFTEDRIILGYIDPTKNKYVLRVFDYK